LIKKKSSKKGVIRCISMHKGEANRRDKNWTNNAKIINKIKGKNNF